MRTIKIATSLAAAALLAGCLVPEKFTASADFRLDGTYLYKFDGTVVHALVAMAESKGQLTDKNRAELTQQVEEMSRARGVKSFKRINDSRYQMSTEEVLAAKPIGASGKTTDVFYVDDREWKSSRILTVTGPAINPRDAKAFNELGIKMDGKVSVTLPSGAKVLENNASGTPGMFNTAYTWKITSVTDKPRIKFQLPAGN